MRYISTRGRDCEGVSSAYAIKTGLASDKGLFMPESIPHLSAKEIEFIAKKSLSLKKWQTLNKHEDIKREYKKKLFP